MDKSVRKLFLALMLFVFSLCAGTTGYYLIEEYEFVDAFYMAVITLSTVGFSEVNELSSDGRLFTAVYILFNLGIIAYAVSVLTSFVFEGKLKTIYKNYMTDLKINKLKDHVIVCGYGRNGKEASEELRRSNRQFVVVEKDPTMFKKFGSLTNPVEPLP